MDAAVQARNRIILCLFGGACLMVLGALLTLAGVPRSDGLGGTTTPRWPVVVVGGVLDTVGLVLVLIGVVGVGVLLALRAAGVTGTVTDPAPAEARVGEARLSGR